MILRKPYAFIIKHFRLIHLIMFASVAYIVYKINILYSFLSTYISEGMFSYTNDMVGTYIGDIFYVCIGAIIVLSLVVISLFVWKKADFKYYVLMIIYYILIFIGALVMSDFLNKILEVSLDTRVLKLYRDVTFILSLPGYYFLLTTVVNTIGFNLKKFNFTKDLKTLSADTKDNEEFEFVVGKNGYKYKRSIRKFFREFGYYIKENKILFYILCCITVIGISASLYLSLYVYRETYEENETFMAGGLSYTVKESYLTNLDYAGNSLSKDKLYLVVKVNILNSNYEDTEINLSNYRVLIDNQTYYPNVAKGSYFVDLGDTNIQDSIPSQTAVDYLFIYEFSEDFFNGSYVFRILSDVNVLEGQLSSEYNDTIVRPKYIENISTVGLYALNEKVEFKESALKNSNITISSFDVSNKFIETYKYCIGKKCYSANEFITAETIGTTGKTLIKLNLDYYIDYESNLYSSLINARRLFEKMATVTYLTNGNYVTAPVKDVTPEYVDDATLYLQVPSDVEYSIELMLNITSRDRKYVFILEK